MGAKKQNNELGGLTPFLGVRRADPEGNYEN